MMTISGDLFYKMLMKIFTIFSPCKYKCVGTIGESILNDFRTKFDFTNFKSDVYVIHVIIFFKSVLSKFKYLYKIVSDKDTSAIVLSCINYIENFLIILNKY